MTLFIKKKSKKFLIVDIKHFINSLYSYIYIYID